MFRSSTIIRELVLSLTKVMLGKLCSYRLCGGVAACLGVACMLCAVQNETSHWSKTETCRGEVYVNSIVKFKPSKFNK
jgi:hypothetical protein